MPKKKSSQKSVKTTSRTASARTTTKTTTAKSGKTKTTKTGSGSGKGVQPPPPPRLGQTGVTTGEPAFAETQMTPDPTQFLVAVTDNPFYKLVDKATVSQLIQSIPPPRDANNLMMSLGNAYGSNGSAKTAAITENGQIMFHSVGDTGSTKGPATIQEVADKMCEDMQEADPADVPAFFYHLGDVVYDFGQDDYYYDQFFDPYREYNAPIFAIPGNHDGEVYPGDPSGSLQAFQKVFCAPAFQLLPEAHGLSRTSMTQPGVYFTLDAPFVRIIGLYSNVLEDPGVISSQKGAYPRVSDQQLPYLTSQLQQIKSSGFAGAVVVAVHHPPQVVGRHGSSPAMLADMDACFSATGVYPHAVFSGHAHNYQRFTRLDGSGRETPFVVAGMGGHSSNPPFGKMVSPPRTPFTTGQFRCDNYSPHYGYLRVAVTPGQMRIEYHDATTGLASKAASDVVTVDLATRKLVAS
jgi:hypothetical protein